MIFAMMLIPLGGAVVAATAGSGAKPVPLGGAARGHLAAYIHYTYRFPGSEHEMSTIASECQIDSRSNASAV
jgi:hypothetical protein